MTTAMLPGGPLRLARGRRRQACGCQGVVRGGSDGGRHGKRPHRCRSELLQRVHEALNFEPQNLKPMLNPEQTSSTGKPVVEYLDLGRPPIARANPEGNA